MAKKSRMGRNLDALLGGASRQRQAEQQPTPVAPDGQVVDREQHAATTEKPLSHAKASESVTKGDQPATSFVAPRSAAPVQNSAETQANTSLSTANATVGESASSSTAVNRAVADAVEASVTSPASSAADRAIAAGIDAGAASVSQAKSAAIEPPALATGERLRMLGVDQIRRGVYQPRREFDQELLAELAESLKTQGMIQPILVRPFAGAYELIAGERRWRAAQLAGFGEIPAIVRELDDQSVASVALIENIQRKDLSPLEEAEALARLCDEFGMTHQAVADSVGRARASVSNLLRLLELNDEVKVMIDRGEIDMGHARALLTLDKKDQIDLARKIVREGLSVRATEKLAKTLKAGMTAIITPPATVDPDIERLSRKLSGLLGAPVAIKHQKRGSGKLEISYTSVGELEGILAHIK